MGDQTLYINTTLTRLIRFLVIFVKWKIYVEFIHAASDAWA